MKSIVLTTTLVIACLLSACEYKAKPDSPIAGTWQLLSHTETSKGVSTVTDYTKDLKMIKIINETHFAFLVHKLNTPKDSTNNFDGGGGTYTLNGDNYTEHLDYCIAKIWEGHKFDFKIAFKGDTLVQTGVEKLEKANIDRVIVEKYVRVK